MAQCHTSHSWPPRVRAGKETWVLNGKKQLPGLSCWLVFLFMWLYMLAHCVLWLPQQSSRKSLIRIPYKDTRVFVSSAKMRFSFRYPKRKVEHINKVHASLDIETNIRRICIGYIKWCDPSLYQAISSKSCRISLSPSCSSDFVHQQ